MHLALIIDDYLPDSTRVASKMFHELACAFVNGGHRVTVITPYYGRGNRLKKNHLDGVEVWYFKNPRIKDVGKIKRAFAETVLSLNAWIAIKHEPEIKNFDAVIYYSPSIFFGPLVRKIKEKSKCYAYQILRDMFPQWSVDAGLIRAGSLIEKYFRFFEKINYSQADYIGLMSQKNVELFNSKYNFCATGVLHNWARFECISYEPKYKKCLGLNDKVIFLYGGNIGHAQDMGNLLRLVRNMLPYDKAHFLFVGQGDEVELVNSLVKQWKLENLTYLPPLTQSEFKVLLSEVDVGLFSLAKNHTAHNFPGKILGYMVNSIPILGSVNDGNDLMPLINDANAGMVYVNGDDEHLFQAALTLLNDKSIRNNMGKCALALLRKEFDVEGVVIEIINKINGVYEKN
ncbi:glycosyltransferase [Escherichia coli]|nr:glycosyltransferase [Escherichia coli]EIE5155788.1 glycosyltransferase family 4 protein [Escherichia coli]